jgi:hypothetical protein
MLFGSLATYVRNKFEGVLVIGDLHADYDALMRDGKAGITIGNHDDKFRLHYEQLHDTTGKLRPIHFSADSAQTLLDVGPDRMDEFLRMYYEIQTFDRFASIVHTFDDLIFVHAASHPTIWDSRHKFDGAARARFLYGEVTGEKYPDGMPIRYYNWIQTIPSGRTVVVGHDRKPIHDISIESPLAIINATGGKAIFIDTGCGKGGFLTGVVIHSYTSLYVIDRYISFKE